MKGFRIVIVVIFVCNSLVSAAEGLTYVDLINRLTDLERLAVLPELGEKCAQFSSYDRRSRYDDKSGKYIEWYANVEDGTGFIREEDGRQVLAEMTGPGVIWRIWSAKPKTGHVKIYLDGSDTPAVDLPFSGFFNRENEPFTRSALVHYVASGANCYIPIPYQKSCKITADPGWGEFYHFTYTTYPEGAILPTFKCELSDTEKTALDRADQLLSNCGNNPAGSHPEEKTENKTITISPGKTDTVINIGDARAITAIKAKVKDLPSTPADRDILRDLVLRIRWDNELNPSVFTPLGDFFGTAPGVNKYSSLPIGMTDEGFYCYWYMPFKESAKLELTNNSNAEQTVSFQISHAPLNKPIDSLGRFHTRWHRDDDLDPAREIDWTMSKMSGRGRFVGVMLHVWNPRGNWWGEGDEKFFIDGEKLPSTFGTGSEDYFGYAWCNPTPFENCYHNQTINVGNKGHVSVNRWHITDNVPFLKSFEGAIEKYFTNDRPTLYDCTAYWYQAEPHKSWQVNQELPGKTEKYVNLCTFSEKAKKYSSSDPIEPLRKIYNNLAPDPDLAPHRNEICLMMAKSEKTAGNEKESQAIIQPLAEELTCPFIDRDLADDIHMVLQEEQIPKTEPGDENVLIVSWSVADSGGDGSAKRIEKDGRWCISTQCDSRPYIYFTLQDKSKFRNTDKTVNLRITYYSDGKPQNLFRVQYDSYYSNNLAGRYQDSTEIISSNTAGWQTVVVSCPRAKFAGGQNGESDFRIYASGNSDVLIGDIKVENP